MSQIEQKHSRLERLVEQVNGVDGFDDDSVIYRIGDLSREFDVTLRTLRFYEDRGLLSPKRSGSTRLYSANDRSRLKLILLAKRVGFSLVDIHELMDIYDMGATSDKHLGQVLDKFRAQMDVLHQQKEDLENSIVELHETIDSLEDML